MPRDDKPFHIYVRREPGYELTLTVRFEVADGHGILGLQGESRKETSPALVHEENDVSARALRGGRFIHVLSGSGRRQSYSMSRLTEERLQRVSDETWTELQAITEYGFRYLVVPDSALVAGTGDGAPARVAMPEGGEGDAEATPPTASSAGGSSLLDRARASSGSASQEPSTPAEGEPGARKPSALERAMSAIRSRTPDSESVEKLRRGTPRPAPTAKVAGQTGAPGRPPTFEPTPEIDATTLTADEARAKVQEYHRRLRRLERKLNESIAREKDLVEIIARWQQREIES